MNFDQLVETILDIPLAQMHDSPTQPRKLYREATLREMAATMRPPGRVEQPIVVRPLPVALRPLLAEVDTFADYEIVFGHCRKRAAELAGLKSIPAIVRPMTDAEVLRAQVVENLARSDVHPIEEAEAFQALMKLEGKTADQIADDTGKSRSYVYGRLTLLKGCAEIRTACLAGEIGSEVMLLVARLRTEKLQQQALAAIKGRSLTLGEGGKDSFRSIRSLLQERFTLALKGKSCLFDPADAALLPDAGACTTCPKRSGNAPEYSDLLEERAISRHWPDHKTKAEPELCTDPDCYAAKKTAHLANEAAALKAKGEEVIEGNKARNAVGADGTVKGAYVALASVKTELAEARARSQKDSKAPPPVVVTIQNPRDGTLHKAVLASSLVAAGVAAPKPKGGDTHAQQQAQRREQEARCIAKASRITEERRALLQRVRAEIAKTPRSAADLHQVARVTLEGVPHNGGITLGWLYDCHPADLQRRLGSMSAAELTTLMMDCALVEGTTLNQYSVDQKAGPLEQAAKRYGVEPVQASAPAAAPPAAAAPKPQPLGGKVTARYRNAATGETWSGRGLKPKWLTVALASGKTLADFELSTPSPAARAPKGAVPPAAPAEPTVQAAWPFPKPKPQGKPPSQMDNAVGSAAVGHAEAGA